MFKKSGWDIQLSNMNQFLENVRQGTYADGSIEATTTFTLFRNGIREETEIAELVAATGTEEISELVALPFERFVLFETVAALETEVQMKEENLKTLAVEVFNKYMKRSYDPISKREVKILKRMELRNQNEASWATLRIMESVRSALTSEVQRDDLLKAEGASAKALKTFETIKKRFLSQEYKPTQRIVDRSGKLVLDPDDENTPDKANALALALTEKIVHDRFYRIRAQEAAKTFVDERLKKVLDEDLVKYPRSNQPLQRLSVQTVANRHTFMLVGAPACGKGSIIARLEYQVVRDLHINWDDVIKINTDNHREIVSTAAGLGDNSQVHAELNNFEAFYISTLAYARVQAQLEKGRGHHLFIDSVYPTEERLRMGICDSGTLHVICVSIPVDVSVERAFKRGHEVNRYVPSRYLIGSHKYVSQDLLKNMIETCHDTGSELSIFNTDVAWEEEPIKVMQLDMSTKIAIIYDPEGMALIYGKKNVNANAKDSAHLYTSESDKADYSYVTQLESLGIIVTYKSAEMKQKVDELIHDKINHYQHNSVCSC